jgi:hypothetical protein
MQSFNGSFINEHGEFIAHRKANEYFNLKSCENEIDIKCKVLEWFSRGASKTEPFNSKKQNKEFQTFMLDGINNLLDTDFKVEEMRRIYTWLGNCSDHKLCVTFINSGFNMDLL